MEHFAGIDVSLKDSSVCVVDATGRIVREAKVASEPERSPLGSAASASRWRGSGLEAGPLSQWLHAGLGGAGFEAALLETRHVKAALSAMVVKTDRKDARGIAQLLRMGWFRPVHRKSPDAQEVRALLVGRKLLQAKLRDVELSIRGILRGFSLKVGEVSKGGFAARIRELAAGHEMLETVTGAMLAGARGAAGGVRAPAPAHAGDRARRRGLPAADDGAGRGRAGVDRLQDGGGRPGPLRVLQGGRGAFRPHAEAVPIGRDGRDRRDQQERRRDGAHRALRGRQRDAEPPDALLGA
jgi:transposase